MTDDDKDSLQDLSRSEREIVRFARGSSFSVMAALVSQAGLLLISLTLTRFLSRSAVGLYAQAHAVVALGSILALVGMRSALTRFVAMHRADDDEGAVHGALRLGLAISVVGGTLLGLLVWFSADWQADVIFDDPELGDPLRWAALMLPATTVLTAAISATQGFRNVRPYNVVRRLFEPGAKLVATLVVLAAGGGINAAMAVSTVVTWIATLVALGWLLRLARPLQRPIGYAAGPMVRFALVSWGAAFAAQGLLWADIMMVGWLRPSSDVAVYQIASRVTLLASLGLLPINSIVAPRLANLFQNRRRLEAATVYQVSASWALRLTLPAAVAIFVMPGSILSVFGSEYTAGVAAALILAPGQIFHASTGTSASALNMAGENVLTLIGNTGVLVLNLALNALLIPLMGIEGAALAWTIALTATNIFQSIMVKRRLLDVWPWTRTTTMALVAALVAAGAGALVHHVILDAGDAIWAIAPTGLVIAVVYLAITARFGVTDDDRLIMERFRPTGGLKTLRTFGGAPGR